MLMYFYLWHAVHTQSMLCLIASPSGGEELPLQRFSYIYSADKLSCNAVSDLACY